MLKCTYLLTPSLEPRPTASSADMSPPGAFGVSCPPFRTAPTSSCLRALNSSSGLFSVIVPHALALGPACESLAHASATDSAGGEHGAVLCSTAPASLASSPIFSASSPVPAATCPAQMVRVSAVLPYSSLMASPATAETHTRSGSGAPKPPHRTGHMISSITSTATAPVGALTPRQSITMEAMDVLSAVSSSSVGVTTCQEYMCAPSSTPCTASYSWGTVGRCARTLPVKPSVSLFSAILCTIHLSAPGHVT